MIMEKRRKVFDFILLTLRKTGLYFMIFTMLIALLASIDEGNQFFAISYFKFILLTSFLFALESYVLSIEKISTYILKVVIHYVLTLFSFVLVMCTWAKTTTSGKQTFILAIVYTAVYALFFGIKAIFMTVNKKKKAENQEYKNQFLEKTE